MSIEHSVICDRCGSVVAAASTVALARADANRLGAQQDARRDLCARCLTADGSGAAQPHADQHGESAAASNPTGRLGDGLVELLVEFVREAIDSRIAELASGGAGSAGGGPGSAASAFSERMSR